REAIFTLRKIFPQADNPRTKLLHAIVALFTHLETGEGACPKRAMRDLLDAEFELGYLKARQQDDSNIMLTDILRNLRDLVRLIADREISAKITKLFPCQFPLRRTVKSSDGEKILYDSSSMSADDFFGVTPDGGTLEDAFRADYCRWQSRKYRDVDGALEMTRLECPMPDNFTVKIHRVHGDANGKNTLRCEFPESIDMSQFTSDSSSESLEYRLISIIAHCGTMDGGHYKAYVYRNGKWFECNDSIIREVSWSDIENAYGGRKDGFHATTLGYEKKPSNHYDRPPLL
ncbi:MAG: ubiquitin carboxyl-terminal hydrolase, partial [Puniceicoccales bacterium]|nr:ubiquitin carboxyl-terminal hydrolase [Puniceicoccales bacterium]